MPVTPKSVELAAIYAKANFYSSSLGEIASITAAGGRVMIRWTRKLDPDNYSEEDFVEKVKAIAAKFGDPVPF